MKSTLAFVILILSGFSAFATVYHSNGLAADVQLIHDTQAVDGDTITLPAGTFTWSIPVTISKAVKIQGEGSGRIIGDTKSSVTIGTGSKTFTTTRSGLPITTGQTFKDCQNAPSTRRRRQRLESSRKKEMLEGTVTSYSGTTLVIDTNFYRWLRARGRSGGSLPSQPLRS